MSTPLRINERTSGRYLAKLRTETLALLTPADLTTFRLRLYDKDTGTVLNNRNWQDVLNANGVTLYSTLQTAADGKTYNLAWTLAPADNAVVTDGDGHEEHVALFHATTPSGREMYYEATIWVKRLAHVPEAA